MEEGRRRSPARLALTIAAFAPAYALFWIAPSAWRVTEPLHDWWWRGLGDYPSGTAVHRVIDLVGHATAAMVGDAYAAAFVAAVALVPLGFLTRALSRARVRAGGDDPLDRPRAWVAAHAGATRALTAAPAFATAIVVAYRSWSVRAVGEELPTAEAWAIVAVIVGALLTAMLRAGLRVLLAPTFDPGEPLRADVRKEDITFDAVAVTPETLGAIGAMVALTVLACVAPWVAPKAAWLGPAELAYFLVALGGAAAFRRASRVAVGVDGVFVSGTSRTRFFAYRALDEVRVDGGDVVLARGGSAVLRLQLHGDDAARRDAIVQRIAEAIARAKGRGDERAARMVQASAPDDLARAAVGGADYRSAPLTRDALWALVEGPAPDARSRAAAAAALAATGDDSQRERLRIAADTCAEPAARAALRELVTIEDDAARADDWPSRRASR